MTQAIRRTTPFGQGEPSRPDARMVARAERAHIGVVQMIERPSEARQAAATATTAAATKATTRSRRTRAAAVPRTSASRWTPDRRAPGYRSVGDVRGAE